MPDAIDYGFLEEAFDGGCAVPYGFELADAQRRIPGRWRRTATTVFALVAILLLHAGLLFLWRATRDASFAAPGPDAGAGGIELSLVSGRLGGPFAQATAATADNQPDREQGAAQAPLGDAVAPAAPTGEQGADTTTDAQGHSAGAIGAGDTAAQAASAGGGYDPGAFASMAPLSFTQQSEPGLWEQVRRCFKDAPLHRVTLNVVLDDAGIFIDAYKDTGALVVSAPSPQETQALAQTLDALRGCSPYHGMPGGLAKRLVLVVPAEGGAGTASEGRGG